MDAEKRDREFTRSETREAIEVVAYSGYQGEQEPRALIISGERLDVVAIVDRWYDPEARYFRVQASDGRGYLLRYDLEERAWSRVGRPETNSGRPLRGGDSP